MKRIHWIGFAISLSVAAGSAHAGLWKCGDTFTNEAEEAARLGCTAVDTAEPKKPDGWTVISDTGYVSGDARQVISVRDAPTRSKQRFHQLWMRSTFASARQLALGTAMYRSRLDLVWADCDNAQFAARQTDYFEGPDATGQSVRSLKFDEVEVMHNMVMPPPASIGEAILRRFCPNNR